MKKERVEYIVSSFTDFEGKERQFVMAALSMDLESGYEVSDEDYEEVKPVTKALHIGVSVCNAKDVSDETLGKAIALGKARSEKTRKSLYATDSGLINIQVVQALLKQESEYFKQNPGKYIAGYNKAKDAFIAITAEEDAAAEAEARLGDLADMVDQLLELTPEEVNDLITLYNHRL